MNVLNLLRRQKLLPRLYLFEAILFTAILLAFTAIGHFILEPGIQAQLRGNLIWTANEILDAREDPARLRKQVESLQIGTDLSATVFSATGQVVISGGRERFVALAPIQVKALVEQGALALSPHAVAVPSLHEGSLQAYVIASAQSHSPPLWHAAIVYCGVLIALAIASVPLARWIARPLERLAAVTRAFGLGDLRARADPNRYDEFGDLARAFNTMADRVEQLRRAEKQLLANVSHELRTPLARIRVVLELAQDDAPAVAQRYLNDISEDLTELEQILADIIATARLDFATENQANPYPPLRKLPLRVSEFAEALLAKFQRQHPDRKLTKHIEGDCTLQGDRVMLAHAIRNVLDNAHKYSNAPSPIQVSIQLLPNSVALSVKDFGIGIGADDLPKLCTPFFRADPSRARGTGGVGLGLALAKRLVEAHGGSLAIQSELGVGTEVTIHLPREVS
jgi:signal transduction histidine kinase